MCQDTGISPQHNRVLLIGNVALFFETGYLIFNLGVIILFSKYASITSDSGTSRRLDALMGAPSPVMWIDEQMEFEMVPYYDFAARSLQTDKCPFKGTSTEAEADAAFTACCKSCQKTFLDAKGELNVDIASTLTGMVTACILGMVANLLIFIGLCALTCCCCSQNRTNPESCWWKPVPCKRDCFVFCCRRLLYDSPLKIAPN